jgi:hypothetical protein
MSIKKLSTKNQAAGKLKAKFTLSAKRSSSKRASFSLEVSAPLLDGLTYATAALSASAIKNTTGTNTDGVYWINLPNVGPTQTYCIMNSNVNGGGWMLAMKATRGTTFNFYSNHWTSNTVLNNGNYNRNDGDAKFDTMNQYNAKDLLALWPDITDKGNGALGSNNIGSYAWLENNYNGGSSNTLIEFFSTAGTYNTGTVATAGNYGGKFIKDAKTTINWQGNVFSSQPDIRFYGFNYKNYPGYTYSATRWGFGWNENGEPLYSSYVSLTQGGGYSGSSDTSGGIGMDTGFGNYSAGDYLGCCNDSTGINRSARVEVYIR